MLHFCKTFHFLYIELENNLAINILFVHTQEDVRFLQVHLN